MMIRPEMALICCLNECVGDVLNKHSLSTFPYFSGMWQPILQDETYHLSAKFQGFLYLGTLLTYMRHLWAEFSLLA